MMGRAPRYDREACRTLPMLALAMMGGIWLATRTTPGAWVLLLLPIALLAALLAIRTGRRPTLAAALTILALSMPLAWARLNPAMPPVGRHDVTGTVYGNAQLGDEQRLTWTLCDVTIDGKPFPGKAYCSLTDETGAPLPTLFDGARLAFSGKVYTPSGKENVYDFDFRMWLLQKGIGYGISSVRELTVLNDPATAPWTDGSTRIRNACESVFADVMGDRGRFAMAMLLGETDGLESDEQQAFRTAGVAHVLAVSGLHVGLMAQLLTLLLGWLHVARRKRFAATAAFLLLYCFVTGFSPASVRAAVMYLLLMLGQVMGRRHDPLSTLSAAAILVLLLNPLQLFSASFTLSFGATAGILLLYMPILRRLPQLGATDRRAAKLNFWRRLWRRIVTDCRAMLAVSLSAQIGVLLPTACYFHRFPLYGIVVNLAVVPLVGLLVPCYAVTLAVAGLPILGDAFGFLSRLGTDVLLWLIGLGSRLPLASIRVPSAGLPVIVGLIACVVAFSRLIRAKRVRRAVAVALIAVIAAVGAYANRPPSLRYHQLAVGQGDASLIVDGRSTIVVDVGSYGEEVAQRLMAEGRDVDALLLTHLHLDHAQGVEELLASGVCIGRAYVPDGAPEHLNDETGAAIQLLQAANVPIETLAAGDTLRFDRASIRVLWPERGRWRDGVSLNDRAMALLLTLDGVRILNMADVGEGYELYAATPCDVLKVGHHGSAEATRDDFLRATHPTIALVTCREGSDSLPSAETLERIAASGAALYRTDETGEILIVPQDGGYRITTYKEGNET